MPARLPWSQTPAFVPAAARFTNALANANACVAPIPYSHFDADADANADVNYSTSSALAVFYARAQAHAIKTLPHDHANPLALTGPTTLVAAPEVDIKTARIIEFIARVNADRLIDQTPQLAHHLHELPPREPAVLAPVPQHHAQLIKAKMADFKKRARKYAKVNSHSRSAASHKGLPRRPSSVRCVRSTARGSMPTGAEVFIARARAHSIIASREPPAHRRACTYKSSTRHAVPLSSCTYDHATAPAATSAYATDPSKSLARFQERTKAYSITSRAGAKRTDEGDVEDVVDDDGHALLLGALLDAIDRPATPVVRKRTETTLIMMRRKYGGHDSIW